MILRFLFRRAFAAVCFAATATFFSGAAHAATFQVTSNADAGPSTLDQAIRDANLSPGADTISFSNARTSLRIALVSTLEPITEAVTIDGYTHRNARANALTTGATDAQIAVEVNGSGIRGSVSGLVISNTANVVVRGLSMTGFSGNAISIGNSNNVTIAGCFLGLTPTGTRNANSTAITLSGSATNTIGGSTIVDKNLISGNTLDGVRITATSTDNRVRGNLIGTNSAGKAALGNGRNGIGIDNSDASKIGGTGIYEGNVLSDNQYGISSLTARNSVISGNFIGTDIRGLSDIGNSQDGLFFQSCTGNLIGDASSLGRNVISYNDGSGIEMRFSDSNRILTNRIGVLENLTAAAGRGGTGNGADGVSISFGKNNVVGAAGDGNIICANGADGVLIIGSSASLSTGNSVAGNFIGLTSLGDARPNATNGIEVSSYCDLTTIGTIATNGRNYLSGNGAAGVLLTGNSTRTTLLNNYIGTDSNGRSAKPNGSDGVRITASSNVLGNNQAAGRNVISGNSGSGVAISGGSNRLLGNYIGVDEAGTGALGNGDGVIVSGLAAINNIIGDGGATRNVIAANNAPSTGYAIYFSGGARNNRVYGCFIGTDFNGTAPLPNKRGIVVEDSSNTIIGAVVAASRNIIAGGEYGVLLIGSNAQNNTVTGNYIGTDSTGNAALPCGYGVGIFNGANANTIGGDDASVPGSRNLISGNTNNNILISNARANFVSGNRIGTRADGLAPLGNFTTSAGIAIAGAASGNTIGGSVGTRNVIAGNAGHGIQIQDANTSGNSVLSNLIGVGADGTTAVANNGSGILISDGAAQNTIGGVAANAGNRILHNGADGVTVLGLAAGAGEAFGNAIRGNSIYSNAELGINLRLRGEAANVANLADSNDADSGPNNLQNAPVVTAVTSGANVVVTVRLSAVPNTAYLFDLYRSTAADPVAGEGQTYTASSASTTSDASGILVRTFTVPAAGGAFFSATATANGNSASTKNGDTSEFSRAVRASAVVQADLGVRQTAFPDPVTVNNTLTYSFTVTNKGPGAASRVTLTDTIPVGATFISATPITPSQSGRVLTFALGNLASGATRQITLNLRVGTVGTATNVASVTATETDPNNSDNTTSQNVTVAGIYARNLIVNGDAESGSGSASGNDILPIPGWVASGGFTVTRYGASGYPQPSDPGPPSRGSNFFSGGPNSASSAATQTIDISAGATQIDARSVTYDLRGFLGGYASQGDNIALTAEFVNGSNSSLGTARIGPVTPAQRGNATALLSRAATGTVPAGTRTIRLTLQSTRTDGTANDGYADSVSLTLVVATGISGTLAWGDNSYGQIGDGSTTQRSRPVLVSTYGPVTTLAAGGGHSLAAQISGAKAAGYNAAGQLADGSKIDRTTPVSVSGLANIKVVAAGWYHSLALLNDGTVWAWGYNASGELGDGTTTDRSQPVRVAGLTGVIAISAGTYHSAALKSDGTVWTWGNNFYGQLGDGRDEDSLVPVRVNIPAATAIACGGAHTLAISGASVYSWGWNSDGQLGSGSRTERALPAQVPGTAGATRIAAGYIHSLALVGSVVRAWGDNELGQLGNSSTTDALSPVTSQMTNAIDIAAGGAHSLALRADKTLWAWGNNTFGGLGDNSTTNRTVPQPVAGLSNVTLFSGGYAHTMAVGNYIAPIAIRALNGFSSASASAVRGTATLAWAVPLDASVAAQSSSYSVTVNGIASAFTVAYSAMTNTSIFTVAGGLRAGDSVGIEWHTLKTASGASILDGKTQLNAS